LFDEEKPIMISPAIGNADRLSSCAWPLREIFKDGGFNVEVLAIGDQEEEQGSKGQKFMRYNVNGILLDDPAFEKLRSEITLQRVNGESERQSQTMYVGRFPDIKGKERELVIRQGQAGLWRHGQAVQGETAGTVFYEVLPNSKLASRVLDMVRRQSAKH